MSQFYSHGLTARRYSTVSSGTEDTEAATIYLDAEDSSAPELDLEQSIYIFPAPGSSAGVGSGLSSPFATSSELSVPTDVSFPPSEASEASGSQVTRGRANRAHSSASGAGTSDWEGVSPRSTSADTGLRSPAVEVWDISVDGSEAQDDRAVGGVGSLGEQSELGSAELEEAVGRASRWDALHGRRNQHQQRFPLGQQQYPSAFEYAEGRFQLRRRMRSFSPSVSAEGQASIRERERTISYPSSYASKSLSEPRTRPPQTPLRLPLLSFFSSFFSMDDSTLHLLTRPTHPHASPLFVGPQLQNNEHSEDGLYNSEKRTPLSRLGASELETVKEGIEVACDASVTPENRFALPLPSLPFLSLWNLVAGVAAVPSKMWGELRRPVGAIPAA